MGKTVETKGNQASLLTEPSLFLLSLLVAFVLIFGVACLAAYHSYSGAVHYAIRSNETRAELLGRIVLEHHRAAIGIVQAYASRPLLVDSVKKKDVDKALVHLTDLSKENPEIATSWISNPDSTTWVNFPFDNRSYGKDLTQRDWYKGVSKDWKPYVSDIYKLITGEQGLAVSLCVPIRDETGKVIGIFGSSLTTKFYNDLVEKIGFGMDADIALVDRAGHIIYSNRYPDRKEVIDYPLFGTVTRAKKETTATIEVRDASDRGRVEYVSLAPVEEIGWSVVVEKPKSAVLYSVLGEIIQIAVISLLTFLMAVFLVVNSGRKQRQLETLKKQSKILREQADLIELSHEAIIVRDPEGRITFWNQGAEEMYGWTRAEAVGMVTHTFLKGRATVTVHEHTAALIKEGHWEGELGHTTKDGRNVTVLSRQALQRDEAGNPAAVLVINIDITDRKRAEIDLRASEERWATTLASIGDAVIATDLSGSIMFMNAVAETLTGWTFGNALQKPVAEVFHIINEQTRLEVENPISKVLREGVIVGLANHTLLVKKDGTEVPIDDSGAPVRDKEGKTTGVVLIFRDITDRKQAEERLQHEINERSKTEEQLRQVQKMEALGTMAGGIAHDFNNMLAAIVGFTELVTDHVAKDSREAHHLKRIMESSLRGRDLVRQMLTFSRKTEQEKKPLSLSSIVKETVRLVRATTPTTITIKVETLGESGLILADPTQMQQVIMNLCTNAAHAMREKGGTLDIQLSDHGITSSNRSPHGIEPGLYTRLTVRDTGTGMSPDIMDKIFDPFFTTKKLGEGTGLGLSVVHGIVKQSSGHITVESEPGRGSTFTLYFPQITGELEADVISDDEIPTGSERILFVDDEEALVEMGEDILAELGYEVTSRTSSREALSLFKTDPSRFDLIITDQTMPEMTGVELAKEVLGLRADVPIIMCTGFSYAVDADKAKAAGIKAFAMKPLTKREIARTIRKVLDE